MDLDQDKWLQKYNLTKNSKIIDVRTPQEFQELEYLILKISIFMIRKIL